MVDVVGMRMGLNEWTGSSRSIVLRLPPVLDDLLASLNAGYSRMPMGVRQGLHADDAHNRIYLGTYFPRSFGEWGLLWAELLAHEPVRRRFLAKEEIDLVSFGSGTGGDVMGALYAIQNEGLPVRRVRIYSFDGNADALEKQRTLLDGLRRAGEFSFALDFECRPFTWGLDRVSFRQSCEELRAFLPAQADLVQASKWLVEFYNYQNTQCNNLHAAQGILSDFLRFAERLVAPTSMVAIADVTTSDCGRWFPTILNGESNDYLAQGGGLRTISPIPCAFQQGNCPTAHTCYTRRAFNVSSRFCVADNSQLCYRVFAPMDFANDITQSYKDIPYRVSWYRNMDCHRGTRGNFVQDGTAPSGFSAYCAKAGV